MEFPGVGGGSKAQENPERGGVVSIYIIFPDRFHYSYMLNFLCLHFAYQSMDTNIDLVNCTKVIFSRWSVIEKEQRKPNVLTMGRDINANVSLHSAPNTAEHISPNNAHWLSSHFNYLVDSASDNPNSFVLDSKDAKCVVCGDIDPVLKPGRSW